MRLLAFSVLFFASIASAAVPPPPVSAEATATATNLARALEANDAGAYERLLAPNLEVWIDGKKSHSTAAEWLKDFRPKLSSSGVRYKVERILSSNSNFLILSHFDSRGSFPVGQQECCQFYEVSQYEFQEGKVYRIRILTTGNNEVPTK